MSSMKLGEMFRRVPNAKRKFLKCFCTKHLKTGEFDLTFKLNKKPVSVEKVAFIFPLDRLHHNFALHFKKQIFARSELKDSFSTMRIDLIQTQIPFHFFEIQGTDIAATAEQSKTLRLGDFALSYENEAMQIFAGDYTKFKVHELETAKLDFLAENLRNFAESTSTEEQAHKVFLNGEEAMKVAVSKYLDALKKHVEKTVGKTAKVSGNVTVSFRTFYMPIYLLLFGNFGITYRVLVNGVTGKTCGPIIPSPLRIGVLLFGITWLYFFFSAPNYPEYTTIFGESFGCIPILAAAVLTFFYYVAKRQIKVKISQQENEFRNFYRKVQESQKRTFYQNWFLHQNEKEMFYHQWIREASFEDYRGRFENAYPHSRKDYFNAKFGSAQGPRSKEFRKHLDDETRRRTEAPQRSNKYTPLRKLYAMLNVDQKATRREIESAFKALTMIWHPDKYNQKGEEERRNAERKFNDIMSAYEILKDDAKRRNYDLTGSTEGYN